jgi:hypothetical protein
VSRVEYIIRLHRHQRARDPQDRRFSSGNPIISQPSCGWSGRTLPPVCRDFIQLERKNERIVKLYRDQNVSGQRGVRLKAGQHLERRQGPGFRSIDGGNPGAVPATTVQTRPFPVERRFYVPSFDNPPSLRHQSGIPCSSRPMRFSTSRAPTPVVANSNGVSPANAAWGAVNQLRVPARFPSKS